MSTHGKHLARVSSKIAPTILLFYHQKIQQARLQFHMEELLRFVAVRFPTAPDSPSRVMRDLRQHKYLAYKVVNRRASLYEILLTTPVATSTSVLGGSVDD